MGRVEKRGLMPIKENFGIYLDLFLQGMESRKNMKNDPSISRALSIEEICEVVFKP